MSALIYIIIIILFLVYILWTWNNTKCFEGTFTRISYMLIGTVFITLGTYIMFSISKRGIEYSNDEILSTIRNIILLVFVPVNGFIVLPQIGRIIGKIKNDEIDGEKLNKIAIICVIVLIVVIIFECHYFSDIQNKIIQIIGLNKENL